MSAIKNKIENNIFLASFYDVSEIQNKHAFSTTKKYISSSFYFSKFESYKFMYKLNKDYRQILSRAISLSEIGEPRIGMQTNDNNRFIRDWFEIRFEDFYDSYSGIGKFPAAKWFYRPFSQLWN